MVFRDGPDHVVYTGWDRIDVRVRLEDGTWADGELRSWDRGDGQWSATVQYSRGVGENYLGRFAAGDVEDARVPLD